MDVLLTIIAFCIPLLLTTWLIPEKWRFLPMLVATSYFLYLSSPISLLLLTTTTLTSYYLLKHFNSVTTAAIIAVVQIVVIFLFFKLKYGVIFIVSESKFVPLGLSYYAFRQIHYAIECYKKQIPKHTIIDYFNFMFFLPTLLVGPINRFAPFLKDYKKRRWNSDYFSEGLERILYGLVKIVFIGNFLLSLRLRNFTNDLSSNHEWLKAYLNMFNFTANSYIQFAGYSDVAIGLSLLLGFRIRENFNSPFLASNISDFWRRYHISLSEWCRDYVYFPFLAITRNSKISILFAMIVLGIWHEISLRYLFWGFSHAIAISIWHKYESSNFQNCLNKFPLFKQSLGIFITLHFVMLSFLLISEDTLLDSFKIFKLLFFIKSDLHV